MRPCGMQFLSRREALENPPSVARKKCTHFPFRNPGKKPLAIRRRAGIRWAPRCHSHEAAFLNGGVDVAMAAVRGNHVGKKCPVCKRPAEGIIKEKGEYRIAPEGAR